MELVREKVKKDRTGHDYFHLLRTEKYALWIAKHENNVDKEVLSAAALIHDVGRVDELNGKEHISVGVELAEKWLQKINFPNKKIPKVIEAIKLHEQRIWQNNKEKVKYKETLVIQDADRLDIIGALGIARAFQFAGAHNIKLYEPKYKIKSRYIYRGLKHDPSELHHIMNKYLNEKFNTKTAKKLSKKRIKFIKEFVKRFVDEWEVDLK